MLFHTWADNRVCTYNPRTKRVVCLGIIGCGKGYYLPIVYSRKTHCVMISSANTGSNIKEIYKINGTKAKLVVRAEAFNGKFDSVFLCEGRFSSRGVRYHYFDRNWNYLPYCPYPDLDVSELKKLRPQNYDEMISIAEKLAEGIPEVRIDLYEINGQVYFGEMTFFSQSGWDTDITYEADKIMGEKIVLPQK